MAKLKSIEWYKEHPEVLVRHHATRWTTLQIKVLIMLFEAKESLYEMTRMLGRTEYGIFYQLQKQKLVVYDSLAHRYYQYDKKTYRRSLYDGKGHR